jgi:hypothetical protein
VHTPERQVCPPLHATPHDPQFALSVDVSTHDAAQRVWAPEQPLTHVGDEPAVEHNGVAPEHITLHAPQDVADESEASHPFARIPSQSAKPGLQTIPQTPAVHVGAALADIGQALPQLPQFATSEAIAVSQPSALTALQSAKPALHTRAHAPAVQTDVACARIGHPPGHGTSAVGASKVSIVPSGET